MTVAVAGPMTVSQAAGTAAQALAGRGIEQPRFEAALLVALALNTGREWVLAHPEGRLTGAGEAKLQGLLERRLEREPLAYLRGEQEFYGRSFCVSPAVMVPRPETELLVEVAIQAWARARARGRASPLVIDVGTGAGVLGITVALECPGVLVVATDLSWSALEVARRNARRLGASNVRFLQGDLLAPLRRSADLLLANLPYIPAGRWSRLQPELHWEPSLALLGGPTGLELIEGLLAQARPVLAPGAEVLLEIDEAQGPAALGLAARTLPAGDAEVLRDHAGLDRVLHVRL